MFGLCFLDNKQKQEKEMSNNQLGLILQTSRYPYNGSRMVILRMGKFKNGRTKTFLSLAFFKNAGAQRKEAGAQSSGCAEKRERKEAGAQRSGVVKKQDCKEKKQERKEY